MHSYCRTFPAQLLLGTGLDCKQLLDEVFVISRIIKVKVGVISLNLRLITPTLTETSIIMDITKKQI